MPTPSAHAYLPLLLRGRWFAGASPAFRQCLLELARPRQLGPGERLFARGDPPCGLYAVVDGAIQISGFGDDAERAREALLILFEAPDWFGEIALFDRRTRTHDAVADGPATVLHLSQAALLARLDEQPQYWRELGVLMGEHLRLAFRTIEDSALLPAPTRLARRLQLMAEGYGWRNDDGQHRRMLKVTQERLARLLAISRQTTNQILKELETAGVLRLHRNEIEILDLARLRAAAGSAPT